jgi:hypothetical protein
MWSGHSSVKVMLSVHVGSQGESQLGRLEVPCIAIYCFSVVLNKYMCQYV